jgi:hypothetical protein
MSGFINAQAARSRRLATGQGIAPQGPFGFFGTGREHKLNHL